MCSKRFGQGRCLAVSTDSLRPPRVTRADPSRCSGQASLHPRLHRVPPLRGSWSSRIAPRLGMVRVGSKSCWTGLLPYDGDRFPWQESYATQPLPVVQHASYRSKAVPGNGIPRIGSKQCPNIQSPARRAQGWLYGPAKAGTTNNGVRPLVSRHLEFRMLFLGSA